MRLLRLLAAAVALAPAVVAAQHAIVNAEQVQAAMRATPRAIVVDARTRIEFDRGHIPGAVNLPPERVRAEAKRLLPKDKATPLVFYCRGPGWTLSFEAAGAAHELGYTHLLIYRDGLPDWVARGLPVALGASTPLPSH